MRKMINTAFAYAIAAMAGGVFYREFTKFQGFEGRTSLAFVHTHLFLLGMVMLLVIGLFAARFDLNSRKQFRVFYVLYNAGVILTSIMLLIRGVVQVTGPEISRGMDAAISGVAGIGHILTGIGIILLFLSLRSWARNDG